MIAYNIKSALKSIFSDRKFTLINVIGFAFAISVCLAISLFLLQEYSYDSYPENADRIVRIIDANKNTSNIDYRAKDILLESFPEFENACLVYRETSPTNINIGDKAFSFTDIMSVDNNFFTMFSIPFLNGDSTKPFENINSAIVTESKAKQLFGTENPIGKEILFERTNLLTITAVIKDFPANSSISANLLVNAENDDFKFSFSCEEYSDKSTHRWDFRIYTRIAEGIENNVLSKKINANLASLKPYINEIGFLPLKDMYLYDSTIGSQTKRGNPKLLKLLVAIAIIILIIAIVNYINLSLAQQYKRNRIIGIKKSFGASNSDLFIHFIIESIIISAIAFILSIILVWIFTPVYTAVFGSPIHVSSLLKSSVLFSILLCILIVGCLSGLTPALVLSRSNPNDILKKTSAQGGNQSYFRNLLIIFQFTVSVVLIICLLIVQKQISFVKNKNPGFSEEHFICVSMPYLPKEEKANAQSLVNELRNYPFFKSISLTNGVPGRINYTMGSGIKNKDLVIPCLIVDTAFISTFQLKIVKGRNLKPGDYGKVCMVNESFYNYFEFNNLENKKYNNYRKGGLDIIAVVNDFQYGSSHNKIEPLCIIFAENSNYYQLSIKIAANNLPSAMKIIKEKWGEIMPAYPLKYQFFDDWFDQMYEKEERFAKTIGLFALLAIAISCFGILGLAIFSSEQRTKEIGIRKVNGAKTPEIIKMLNKDFIKWVLIAFIIACPIAYYAMSKWLENFAYKTELSWWIFALAGLIAMAIALLTVSFQSYRAATRNPVDSLRSE
ncbi:ABC transporter permease [Ancylomarina sp. 16SWW S1-10-2]|uniref:ABC transporter permease n=1 Tax=Ancylomarina sp. 16SWW S1-10-2 TaxID=2499681 RepID=UPI00189DBE0C|nr:FtsX-like permease family protein [Ancylomarina sp. 16SWW S1-10-2]